MRLQQDLNEILRFQTRFQDSKWDSKIPSEIPRFHQDFSHIPRFHQDSSEIPRFQWDSKIPSEIPRELYEIRVGDGPLDTYHTIACRWQYTVVTKGGMGV